MPSISHFQKIIELLSDILKVLLVDAATADKMNVAKNNDIIAEIAAKHDIEIEDIHDTSS